MSEVIEHDAEHEDVADEVIETPPEGLSEEELERREAALAEVRTFGDLALKSRAAEVSDFGPELDREADRMIRIMRDAMGVGLASTQLGVMHRLLVFAAGLDATPTALTNPRIEWVSGEVAVAEEGCLSLPRIAVDVERPLYARILGSDLRGEPLLLEASGLEARVLQHEIDHLDGVLIFDRTEREQRRGALRALREGEAYSPPQPEADADSTPEAELDQG